MGKAPAAGLRSAGHGAPRAAAVACTARVRAWMCGLVLLPVACTALLAALSAAAAAQEAAPAAAHAVHVVRLAPPPTPHSHAELQLQFAQRLVAAHPDGSYQGPVPPRLLAIPVLQVELNADGSVRRVDVLRHPSTGDEATRLAIAAVRRAAPYGNVSRLPRPWKLVETFLFDDDLRFKPRTLDVD